MFPGAAVEDFCFQLAILKQQQQQNQINYAITP